MAEHGTGAARSWWPGALAAVAVAMAGCGGGGSKAPSGPPTYAVGGIVYGSPLAGLVLRLNGAGDLAITHSGAFLFPTRLADGTAWTVTVLSAPPNQVCQVTGGSGTIAGADATGVSITCDVPFYTVGGTVTGLVGSGLVLHLTSDQGGSAAFDLPVASDGPFAFPAIAQGGSWAVTVGTQPSAPAQSCAVTGGSGTLSGGPVTGVQVACAPPTYAVGGTVAGLAGTGLVLQLNGGADLAISGNGPFAFPAIADGSAYAVTVSVQPTAPAQVCEVTAGTGALAGGPVGDVLVTCLLPWQGTKQLGVATRGTWGGAVATDGSGNVLVAGHTQGALDGQALTGSTDAFLVKYDRSGARLFTRLLGASGASTYAYGVAADADGNALVAGYTTGTLQETVSGARDLFLAKYDPAGNLLWVHQRGPTQNGKLAEGVRVAVDGAGAAYVVGHSTGDIDGVTLTGSQGLVLYKFAADGSLGWAAPQHLGTVGSPARAVIATDVTVGADGHVYVAGYTNGELTSGAKLGFFDAVVAEYDASGNRQRAAQLGVAGGSAWVTGQALRRTADGLFLAGGTSAALDASVSQTGATDLFLLQLDATLVPVSFRQAGASARNVNVLAMDADADGNLLLSGATDGGFDGSPLRGDSDAWAAKYPPSGSRLWVRQLGYAASWTEGPGMACDAAGNAFLAGHTSGNLDGNVRTGTYDLFVSKFDGAGVLQ